MKYFIYRHKSIITAIISIIVLCGCANDEIEVPTKHEEKLYFNATIDRRADQQLPTRAYTGDIDFAVPGFTVAGYYTNGEFSTSNPNSLPFPNVFDYLNPGVDAAVINVKKDDKETNTNRQYWTKLPRLPLSNIFCISYFAWSSSIATSIKAATSTSAHKGAPWIDAQVGAANVDQPDIVGAVSMNHNNEYTVSAIDFDFKHLLSKMSFKVKASNDMRANITKVECIYAPSAVYSEARFTFDGSADVGSWGGHKSYLSASTVQASGWNTITTTTTPALLGSMTFIPQSLTDDALKLKVTYTTTQDGATSSETVRIVSLKALDMEAGKNYVYTLDIKANEIAIFNVTVESWIEIAGTDQGLPLVPGEMDPNVLLLLEGTDPPYTTSDGNRYWLDRSGWNRHCLIVDKMHYSGTNSFDITYDGTKRGYVFNRSVFANGYLYNHIQIPDLGAVTGDIGCEIVCDNQSSGFTIPCPLAISQGVRAYGEHVYLGRTLLVSINEGSQNRWDYANGTPTTTGTGSGDYERLALSVPSGYNWHKLSFYGYSRINGLQKYSVIDNTNSASATTQTRNTSYQLKHGMIGAIFKGTINYVKITKKSIPFEEMMEDYAVVSKKYYISTGQGAYAPKVDGLIACWDARSRLLQGSTNGNGAYWMDQSGNNYFLKATVPSNVNGSFTYDESRKAINSNTPVYPKDGIYMELKNGIEGKHSALTIETVSQSENGYLNFFMVLYDKNNKRIAWIRPNTGTGDPHSYCLQLGSQIINPLSSSDNVYYHNYDHDTGTTTSRRSLVYTFDLKAKTSKIYLNGKLLNSQNFTTSNIDFEIDRIILFNQNNGDAINLKQAFDGYVHAFRIYNRELSFDEINTNYNADRSSFSFNL